MNCEESVGRSPKAILMPECQATEKVTENGVLNEICYSNRNTFWYNTQNINSDLLVLHPYCYICVSFDP